MRYVRERTVTAGKHKEVKLYSLTTEQSPRHRKRIRKKLSTPKQVRQDWKHAREYAVQLVNANFGKGDLLIDLTYEEEPIDREQAERDVLNFVNRVKTLYRKMNSAEQYASGIAVDSYVTKAGGTLDVTVVGLDAEDENRYFGSSVSEKGLITSNKNDTVPDLMVIYSTKRSDGKINLYKFPKAKFTSQGEQTETTDANGIKYSGTALKAEYKNTINNGDDMYIIKAVDPTTPEGKQTIDDWFATATGGLELAKALQTASENVGAE